MDASDFLLTEGYDLATDGSDFVTGPADDQHVALIHLTSQGEWRQSPLTGLNLRRYQSGPMGPVERAELQREGTIQLERDGYKVRTYTVNAEAQLSIDAVRQ